MVFISFYYIADIFSHFVLFHFDRFFLSLFSKGQMKVVIFVITSLNFLYFEKFR